MNSVNRAAKSVVVEVMRQWKNTPGLAEGRPDARPDYEKCVGMVSIAALHAMVYPASFGPLAPLIIGIGLGPGMMAGYIIGKLETKLSLFVTRADGVGMPLLLRGRRLLRVWSDARWYDVGEWWCMG